MTRVRWAQGIQPKNFLWILKDQVAVCERPGGYGIHHRTSRRHTEIVWLREQNFDYVVSLISSRHNLRSYQELRVPYHHVPFAGFGDGPEGLARVMAAIRDHVRAGHKIVVHHERLDETVMGLVAAYLAWMGLVPDGPRAVVVAEKLFEQELPAKAREIFALQDRCPRPSEVQPSAVSDVLNKPKDDDTSTSVRPPNSTTNQRQ